MEACEELGIGFVSYRPINERFPIDAMSKDTRLGEGGGGELLQRFAPEAMTKRHRLEGNLGAAEVELTINDLAGIGRAAAAIQVEGERYPPQIQAGAGR